MDVQRNSFFGWIFLVDREKRVRWMANGIATATEKEAMLRNLRMLVAEK